MGLTEAWQEGKTIKVSEVLALFRRLGVPHFQRGRVWRKDSIAALLESLFYDTPCGSFVFWDSGDNSAHGIAFDEFESEALSYLVIDGQQRIRSLHDAFADAPLNEDELSEFQVSDEQSKKPKQWCMGIGNISGVER